MLLNASHEITFSGLPPDVLDAYVRYKKGTRAIVSWLVQYAPSRYHGAKKLPIRQLADLAASVSGRLPGLPEIIHFYFRETIAARTRLSVHFRKQLNGIAADDDTINHEHFTTNLTEIYENLCRCCGQTPEYCRKQPQLTNTILSTKSHANQFDLLAASVAEYEHESTVVDELDQYETAENSPQAESLLPDVVVDDEELNRELEISSIFQQIQDHFQSISLCWKEVGRGSVPFYAGAFFTNAINQKLQILHSQLHELGIDEDLSSLARETDRSWSGIREPQPSENVCLELISDLRETQLLMKRDLQHVSRISGTTCAIQKPSDYISSEIATDRRPNSRLNDAVRINICQLLSESDIHHRLIREGIPIFEDLCLAPDTSVISLSLGTTMTVHALSVSYSSYINSLPKATAASNCRLTALKLAREASSQISSILTNKTCFPCQCTQTLAWHLQNLTTDFENFSKHRCWNLLFQSPWVAGNHILEMLDLCHYYGGKLLKYRHYIGAVCHSYNALTQLAGLDPIPLLEAFCEEFSDVLFPGGQRPKRNFKAAWSRFVGARLKFKQGHRNRSHRDSWCMAIPAHAAKAAAGLEVCGEDKELDLTCGRSSLLFRIKRRGYNISTSDMSNLRQTVGTALLNRVTVPTSAVEHSALSRNPSASSSLDANAEPESLELLKLLKGLFISRSSTNPARKNATSTCSMASKIVLPMSATCNAELVPAKKQARIQNDHAYLPSPLTNLFLVFADCVTIVSSISDTMHSPGPGASPRTNSSTSEKGMNCICFATTILSGADRIIEARRFSSPTKTDSLKDMGWKKGDERDCVELTIRVLGEVLGGDEKGIGRWMFESLV